MNVKILGTGMTRFGRHRDATMRSLAQEASSSALQDAGLSAGQVGMVVFGNATDGVLHGQEMIRGEVALREAGFRGIPILNVENACASSSSAFYMACLAVESGAVDVALAVGVEKLTDPDKARSFAAIATAVDLESEPELRRMVEAKLFGAGPKNLWSHLPHTASVEIPHSPLLDHYAENSRNYMARTGATPEDFARVSVKNRAHASSNPKAQLQTPVTLREVLASRVIADPLRLLMCAPIGDGAAALVVCSPDFSRRIGGSQVGVEASVLTTNGGNADVATPAERAARTAYEQAGLAPEDLDVAEVHDACAAAELWLYEELGFCAAGEAPKLLLEGTTHLGGPMPVNPSGGLLAKGHPLGATGAGQLVELADQLRGRCGSRQVPEARIALAQNGGGMLGDGHEAAVVVTILSTVSIG